MSPRNPFPAGHKPTGDEEATGRALRSLDQLIRSGRYMHTMRLTEVLLDPSRASTLEAVSGGDGNDLAGFLGSRQPYVDAKIKARKAAEHAFKSLNEAFIGMDKLIQRGLRAQVESTSIETCAGCGAETILPDAEPGRPRTQCQECAAKSRREA